MLPYVDIELSPHRRDSRGYAVRLDYGQPNSDAASTLFRSDGPPVHFDFVQLRALTNDPAAYGQALTNALFASEALRIAFAQARGSAASLDAPLRLRLRIDAPELHDLRWETLRDPDDGTPLLLGERVLFSRLIDSPDLRPVRRRARSDLRALVVIASPNDVSDYEAGGRSLVPFDVTAELERARAGLADIQLTALASSGSATLDNLVSRLREGWDILYLVCHGALIDHNNPPDHQSQIWLEDNSGRAAIVPGVELARQIRDLLQPPCLVVLASCESAGAGEGALSALGPILAEAGVPAVLAMQGSISLPTLAVFMPVFFRELQRDGQIDRAVAVARNAVGDQLDAWMPVLFMRLKSGAIWYVPGFTGEFKKWPALLNNIKNGRCTPILGPSLLEPLIGSTREIARRWAHEWNFPLKPHEREDLPQVMQYLAINQDKQFPRDELGKYLRHEIVRRFGDHLPEDLRRAEPGQLDSLLKAASDLQHQRNTAEVHHVLASLPFRVYITTNPDSVLEEALKAAEKSPDVAICPWNDHVERALDDYDDDEPTKTCPLVFHLFGHLDDLGSLVLTEDDYFDFLIGATRNNDLVPTVVRDALADATLLFLGFEIDSWNFRVLFRSLMNMQGSRRQKSDYVHVAVQVNPEEERILSPERARQYLEEYFHDANISIFWGTVEDFAQTLKQYIDEAAAREQRVGDQP